MQISFFSHGDFSEKRVVRLSPRAEWRLLLNPSLSNLRKKNFVSDSYVMCIGSIVMFVIQKTRFIGNWVFVEFVSQPCEKWKGEREASLQ